MNINSLTIGIHKVKIQDLVFNLSVVNILGIKGVAGFKLNDKPPKKSKHLILSPMVRDWVNEMEII